MRAVIQRVKNASVCVDGKIVGECNSGYMILFCAVESDQPEDIELLAKKVSALRVFCDSQGKMNLSILDVGGEVLCVSQFTLAADTKKGNRPSFTNACEPVRAQEYYDRFCKSLKALGVGRVEKGIFGADMQVSLVNDGPVTIMLDTETWKR